MFLSNPSSHQKCHMETYIFRTCFVGKYFQFVGFKLPTKHRRPIPRTYNFIWILHRGPPFQPGICVTNLETNPTQQEVPVLALCNRGLDMVRVHITFPQKLITDPDSGNSWMYPDPQRTPLWEIPKKKPISRRYLWVIYHPQESPRLNTINTMGLIYMSPIGLQTFNIAQCFIGTWVPQKMWMISFK